MYRASAQKTAVSPQRCSTSVEGHGESIQKARRLEAISKPNAQQDHEEEGQNGGVDEETAFAQEAMDEEAEEATQAYFLRGVNEGEAELEVVAETKDQYYLLWKVGQVDDGSIAWRWGSSLLQKFRQMAADEEQEENQRREVELHQAMVAAAEEAENRVMVEQLRQQGDQEGKEKEGDHDQGGNAEDQVVAEQTTRMDFEAENNDLNVEQGLPMEVSGPQCADAAAAAETAASSS